MTHYDPGFMETSKEYSHRSFPRRRKISSERATGKLMLSIFRDMKEVIRREFLPEGSMVNSESYILTLPKLKRGIQCVRPEDQHYLLQHDNAKPHLFYFQVVQHLPYSLDLAPSDFYLFRHLKKGFKGTRFTSDAELQCIVSFWLCTQP